MTEILTEIKDYDYSLPPELIATYPAKEREKSRLLVYQDGKKKNLEDSWFYDIGKYLLPNDLLVINNTRVSPRRLYLKRLGDDKIFETLFVNATENGMWLCLLRGRRKLKLGEPLYCIDEPNSKDAIQFIFCGAANGENTSQMSYLLAVRKSLSLEKINPSNLAPSKTEQKVKSAWGNIARAEAYFEQYGHMPIPPYLSRLPQEIDKSRYQTVYANEAKSIAAPTAGLHFSAGLLEKLQKKHSVHIAALELRVGYGTFASLNQKNLLTNTLHTEEYYISADTAHLLNKAKGRIIAVGTTTLRALEANFRENNEKYVSGCFQTKLFIKPPDRIYTVDGLVTNFHLPASSLMLLVAAYMDKETLLYAYKHAIQKKYRFFSYGDAMLILKNRGVVE